MEEVFLVIRRKKTLIWLDVRENTNVLELKCLIAAIEKIAPINQQLCKLCGNEGTELMEDFKNVSYYGLTRSSAPAYNPAHLGLMYRDNETSEFEDLQIEPLSSPPDLAEVPPSSRRVRTARVKNSACVQKRKREEL